jgi:hypothetical protein
MHWWWLVALAGCGRIGFDAGAGPVGDALLGDGTHGSGDAQVTTNSVCPTTIALTDDFSAATTSPQWTPTVGGNMTMTQTNGFLEIAFSAGTTPSGSTSDYLQAVPIDYTESCTVVEMDTIPATTENGSVQIRIGNLGSYVVFEEVTGTLHEIAKAVIGTSQPYDPIAHKFLRLRHHQGTWYWEVSPDGMTFTVLFTSPTAFVATPTTVTLELRATTGVQNGGKVDFNRIDVTVP